MYNCLLIFHLSTRMLCILTLKLYIIENSSNDSTTYKYNIKCDKNNDLLV